MKILVIGTIDNRGGAALISWELRKRLKAQGHKVETFVRYKYSQESDVHVIPRKRWQDWLVKFFANDLTFANTDYLLRTKEFLEADLVHCHNLHSNFFNLTTLQKMSRLKPVVWTMHDLWAITGYASDSAARKNPSPKKFLLYLWDNTAHLLTLKHKIYQQSKLHIVAVSDWMKRELEQSILKDQSISRIYNGIDTNIFRPSNDKLALREKLGLPIEKKIVALSTKGWDISQKIIESYTENQGVFFVSLGNTPSKVRDSNHILIPQTADREQLAEYLGAADIFLYPSHGDSFGLIAAEAMACGLPVATWNIDALPEIASHKQTGYVAEYGNQSDLQNGLEYLLKLPEELLATMGQAAQEKINREFTAEKMYQDYVNLYQNLTKPSSPGK